jgi:hypothetical protein
MPTTLNINGNDHVVIRIFQRSNVALLDNGQYVPLDIFGIDVLYESEAF